jgi:hypothetical protein
LPAPPNSSTVKPTASNLQLNNALTCPNIQSPKAFFAESLISNLPMPRTNDHLATLESRRLDHYRLNASRRISTPTQAARYINRYNFCWLFAPRDRKLELPSLYEAVKGRRDAHIEDWDTDSEKLWGWKNDLPATHLAYYGKAFAGKPVFISLATLPFVLAALGHDDPALAYANGALSQDAKRVYDALSKFGAQPTQNLKRSSDFTTRDGSARYHRALDELQHKLIVAPIGATNEGMAWPSQIYDLVARWYAPQAEQAKKIDRDAALRTLIERYLKTVLVAPASALARLFAIPRPELKHLLDDMHASKRLRLADDWVFLR